MAGPKRTQPAQAPAPIDAPLFDVNDVLGASSLTDATAIYSDAMNTLDKQRNAVDIDTMHKKADLLTTTAHAASEVFKKNEQLTHQLTTAQSKRGQIEKIPPLVGRVLGLFDKDYDWGHWNEQVRAAKVGMAANDQQLTQLQMLSQLQEQVLNNSLAMTQSRYAVIASGFDRALDLRKVQTEEQQRAFNNSLAISQENRAKASFAMQQESFKWQQEDRTVASLDDKMLDLASQGKLEGISPALANKEKFNRIRTELDLQQIAQGIRMNDINLENEGRARFLSSQSAEVLTNMAEQAVANNGNITLQTKSGPVNFTATELKEFATKRASSDKAAFDATTDQIITISQMANNTNILMDTALGISHAAGSQGLHPKASRILNEALTAAEAAKQAGNVQKAAEIIKAAVPQMDTVAEEIIKSFPDKQKAFVRSRFDNRPATQQDITDFIGDMAFNPSGLTQPVDAKLAPIWKKIGDEARAVQSVSLQQISKTGQIVDPATNRGEVIQTALGNVMNDSEAGPGVRTQFKQMRDADAYMMALTDLSGKVPWMQGVQSISQFADPNNPGNFDLGRFLTYLRDKHIQDVEAGVIPVGPPNVVRPYDKQFLDYMKRPEFQMKLAKSWGEYSLQGDAVFQAITGGNPLFDYLETLSVIEQTFESTYAAEKTAINNLTTPNLGQFRRRYAPQINTLQEQLAKEDPSRSYADTRKEAEEKVFLQVQSQQKAIIQEGSY